MRRRTFLSITGTTLSGTAAVTLLLDSAASAVAKTSKGKAPAAVENIILNLERQWMDAMVKRDEAALQSLMADDFKRVEKLWPNLPMYKAQWIGNAVRLTKIEQFKYLSMSVRVSGSTAVVSSQYRRRGALGDVPIKELVTAEDTWEQRNGRWQVVLQFVSKSEKMGPPDKPVPLRKAIKVNPEIYRAYVGKYQFGVSRILTIKQIDARLIHQGSGGHSAQLFPETTTRFFRHDAGVLTTFVMKRGLVTHVVHKHTNGRESIGKRIA